MTYHRMPRDPTFPCQLPLFTPIQHTNRVWLASQGGANNRHPAASHALTTGPVHTEALDDKPSDARGPHLPMSDAPFHADPAHQPGVTGPSQGGDINSNPAESRDLTTLPPMCKSSVHADPTHLPGVLGPSHVIYAFAAGDVPQNVVACTQFDTAAISTMIDTMPFAATDSIANEKSVHRSETDAIPDFADPGHALVGPAAEVKDIIVAPEPTTPYTHNGGVSFSKRPATDMVEAPTAKRQRVPASDAAVEATAPWTQPIPEVHSDQQAVQPAIDALPVQVGIWPEPLHQVMVQRGTTTPQLAAAEAAIRESGTKFDITDILGRSIPEDGSLIKDCIVTMFPQDDPVTDVETNLRVHTVDERLTKLWYQEGFVATDEMKFYLRGINDASVAAHPTVFSTPSSIEAQVADIIDQAIDIAAAGNMAYSVTVACLFQGHWMPLKVDIKNDTVTLYTTSEGYKVFVSHAPQAINSGYQWKCIDVPVSFPNDCGFRCIEWIRNFRSYVDVIRPMTDREAIVLKHEFAVAVKQGDVPLEPRISFGGATDSQLIRSLQELVERHGVSADRSHACAAMLLQQIGPQGVTNILAAGNPWKDLKTRASQLQPPVQIVLTSELQAQIQARAALKQPLGRKANKVKNGPKVTQPVRIKPDQIILPTGIFQADNQPLSQIPVTSIGRNKTGVALVSIEEALPFFSLTSPLASSGLALIVLDHQDERLPAQVEKVKFPAQFRLTDEPLLITGAIVQLGQSAVHRALPAKPTVIDEIPTKALRILAYRDQIGIDWQKFATSPFKNVTAHALFPGHSTVVHHWCLGQTVPWWHSSESCCSQCQRFCGQCTFAQWPCR